jgi:hypothetical protein
VGTAQEGFIRQNAMWLALAFVAGLGALFCFRMWLRTYSRPRVNLMELIPLPDAKFRPKSSPKATLSSTSGPETDPGETDPGVGVGTEGGA